MEIIYVIVGIIVFIWVALWLFLKNEGDTVIVVKTGQRTPFELEEITQDSVTFKTKVEFANIGRQCGTIMDCYVRTLLPYEQFDGVKAAGKAEWDQAPREDDYFEALLIQKKQSVQVFVKVKLTARKSQDIKEALSQMVDLSLDLVYQHTGRHPWQISKERIVLTAEEIANLAGVTLAKD